MDLQQLLKQSYELGSKAAKAQKHGDSPFVTHCYSALRKLQLISEDKTALQKEFDRGYRNQSSDIGYKD